MQHVYTENMCTGSWKQTDIHTHTEEASVNYIIVPAIDNQKSRLIDDVKPSFHKTCHQE